MESAQPSTLVERLDALYEFDREPVKEDKLYGWGTFIAMFSSEHIAGTEFVLGMHLVFHGAAAYDVLAGLALGNFLAVLCWAFMCAPIAVKERLTVYWQMRKIAGPYLVVLYSALFAVILCLLAGAMVNVSTTAVTHTLTDIAGRLELGDPNFVMYDNYPSLPWAIVAVAVGTVIALLAILGFEKLTHFAKVVAPWMPFIFLSGAIASLPSLGVNSISDFWEVANEKIWTGVPREGQAKYGFWSCVGLAWLCNITQHMGMGDVTIFRYAKKWQMGFCSAFGMFIGHYMAWICSGIMCAAFLNMPGNEASNPTPADIAMLGAGYAGIVCVLLAGWTTANPTLYRAGLALQVATPNWSRWMVTLVAGVVMIFFACMAWVVNNLGLIVAIYGLFFMPLGAFIFIDYWVFPRLGLVRNYAEKMSLLGSWPAIVGWFGSFAICILLYIKDSVINSEGEKTFGWINDYLPGFLANYEADLFSQVLPAWVIAVTLYIVCCFIQQKKSPATAS